MTNTQKLLNELNQFNGTENWFRNPLFPQFLYTDGVKYLAENAGCYWLIDYIFSNQIIKCLKDESFQVWKLKVNANQSARVIVEDGNDKELTSFNLEYTDFPIEEFTLWLVDKTLLLPSEY